MNIYRHRQEQLSMMTKHEQEALAYLHYFRQKYHQPQQHPYPGNWFLLFFVSHSLLINVQGSHSHWKKWEGIFQSGKSQRIFNRLEKSGKITQSTGKRREFHKFYLLFLVICR